MQIRINMTSNTSRTRRNPTPRIIGTRGLLGGGGGGGSMTSYPETKHSHIAFSAFTHKAGMLLDSCSYSVPRLLNQKSVLCSIISNWTDYKKLAPMQNK